MQEHKLYVFAGFQLLTLTTIDVVAFWVWLMSLTIEGLFPFEFNHQSPFDESIF